ncbi:Asp23/Gls24 family envelope stress response protein [Granulicatella sp. zg-ZJ]|uniref:Asp23/Gls24 family envelope stress response protein n=1 Tax=unclassified Granulicatella TaxID=2630493 RepID=UPI0013BF1E8B|nr:MULTISPECIES: Asp23/Gls24 family envelope stress response protein [unclassified Granulicatella]MBS4751010.1 Asp23/Gls24 family envelope stress response protein [Carnobacteriaceae bacterium zg-ZUI78]NEW62822.1 Asp23/Gls24 family envelope stress response protein [Granulicatella sp. zg-ZJ]NEW65486.1 Asp23/Gls24 family envelope stress response protein [Granulicatella sp. zg-84]QMI85276.1 Asp23/Gls24 family envelope stress response protein [Carnobacteriaceae bacterium zg-84]
MSVKIETKNGHIDLTQEVIATVVGTAVTDNYGVVGMASKHQIRDNINVILKKENYSRGVVIRQIDNQVMVDVYIFVNYGTKISEICRNVQSKVSYDLKHLLGIDVHSVNVYVQGVRIVQD